jgi:Sulfatase protein
LQQDCVVGQKWKCINDEGRWRKHKCKFHKEVQDHLAEISKYLSVQQSKRNCACFTPDGLVYTKIKSEREVFPQKQKRFEASHRNRSGRSRRDLSDEMDELYKSQLPPEFLNLLQMDKVLDNLHNSIENDSEEHSRRKKREVDYITQTIDDLHSVLLTLEKKYLNTTKSPVQCFVEMTGTVNCSTIVYENEEAWHQSRIQIDMLIKVLKDKIHNLKDIKKHLRENRPANMTYDGDDVIENLETSLEDVSEEIDTRKRVTRPTVHQHRHHQGYDRRRKHQQKHTSTRATTEAFISTSELDDTMSSSPTQKSTFDEVLTSQSTSQRSRNRIRITRLSTTTTTTTTGAPIVDEFENASQIIDDIYSTSEATSVYLTSASASSSLKDEMSTFAVSTTERAQEATRRPFASENNVNQAVNSTTNEGSNLGENKSSLPAECYCEPEFERFVQTKFN